MGIKENKSNVIFYPDGLEIKISNNDSNGMHLNEMVNLIKMFNDSSSSEASHSKGIFTDCYIPLEKNLHGSENFNCGFEYFNWYISCTSN